MSQRYIIALLLSAAAIHAADAKDQSLSPADIAKIKGICHQTIGYPVATQHNLWSQLTPFVRSKADLEHLIVDCSSQHCSGFIRLRDDAELLYDYLHVPPEHSKIGPGDLTPDIEYKGNNRFVGAAFIRRGKLVFRRGGLKEWFLQERLHNQSRKASNHAMERTADRRENSFSMITTSHSEAKLALVSGRSSCSR
jgi:hypothetical protein